jgi:hypothetical protein
MTLFFSLTAQNSDKILKYMILKSWFLLIIAVTLTSCMTATAPLASKQKDSEAKSFSPPIGKANLYLLRSNTWRYAQFSFESTLDGRRLGAVVVGRYIMRSIEPGSHELEIFNNTNGEALHFQANAGDLIFYELKPYAGWDKTKARLQQLDEIKGRSQTTQLERTFSAE